MEAVESLLEGAVADGGILRRGLLSGHDEPSERTHRRWARGVAEAVGLLNRSPPTADGGETNVVGERESLEDELCDSVWEVQPWPLRLELCWIGWRWR